MGKKILGLVVDFLSLPLTYFSGLWFRKIRKKIPYLKKTDALLLRLGVFPILDNYYEPLFNYNHLKRSLREDRKLPGLDFNLKEQLTLLDKFDYNSELISFPLERKNSYFFYKNGNFGPGDAEYLYNIIRHIKPRKIIEIGSGYSTLMAVNALKQNEIEDPDYCCKMICVEPYEMPWLEKIKGIKIIRKKLEDVNPSLFDELGEKDILFIDSSHIIRPQGDVLTEYLEILPKLNSGVFVHIHDIFTPKDYLDSWVKEKRRFWNEQYLLEAFLTFNKEFRIIGAVNYLMNHHRQKLIEKCPILRNTPNEPGSFWIVKN